MRSQVYLRAHSDHAAYDAFVERWRAPSQDVAPAAPKTPERADTEIDVAGFRAAWDAMTDTHQFFGITQRFGVSRRRCGSPIRNTRIRSKPRMRCATCSSRPLGAASRSWCSSATRG